MDEIISIFNVNSNQVYYKKIERHAQNIPVIYPVIWPHLMFKYNE